jgi:hypothetical protein
LLDLFLRVKQFFTGTEISKERESTMSAIPSNPITPVIPPSSTKPVIPLPALSLLPSLSNILAGLLQVTGLTSVIALVEKTKSVIQAGNYTPETIDMLLVDVKAMLASIGNYVPGGAFAQIQSEVAKYESISSAIEAGNTAEIADVVYISKDGQHFNCALSLSIKV